MGLSHEVQSEVPLIFFAFHKYANTQFKVKIQTLTSDNSKEYFNQELINYLNNSTSKWGGAKRKNRHLEVARLFFPNESVEMLLG